MNASGRTSRQPSITSAGRFSPRGPLGIDRVLFKFDGVKNVAAVLAESHSRHLKSAIFLRIVLGLRGSSSMRAVIVNTRFSVPLGSFTSLLLDALANSWVKNTWASYACR